MLLVTVIILLVFTLFSFIIFDRDIFAPPTVVSLGLLFSSLCAFYNEEKWALDYSANTTGVISVGVASFIFGGIIAVLLTKLFHIRNKGGSHRTYNVTPIYVEYSKTIIIILFQLLTSAMLFMELRRITGVSSYLEMVAKYRLLTGRLQDLGDTSIRLPWLLRQFLEVNFAIGLLYIYVVGNNIAAKFKSMKINWVPIILCCIITFMQGYRSDMLRLWVALLVITYTLKKRSVGWRSSKETKKMIRIMAVSIVGIAFLFVALRSTVGRAETDWDPIFYLTHYAGSPVAALDLFLKDPCEPSTIWGKESFYNLNQIIGKWFNKPELRYIFYKEFRSSPSGMIIGNVYTALRPPYYDFGGTGGMAVYMIVFGLFFTYLYFKTRNKFGKSEVDFRLLLYAYIAYTFFLYFYNLYNNFISLGFAKFLVELLIVRWYLVGWHFKKRISVKLWDRKKVHFGIK